MEVNDILGTKPIAEAGKIIVKDSSNFLFEMLSKICLPAAEEFGLLLKDNIHNWRLNNTIRVLEKAKDKLEYNNNEISLKANPRVAIEIMEHCSLSDSDEVQEMWAGLFVSSCTKDGQNDENLLFINLLKQLTLSQAQILKYACEKSLKLCHSNGLITASHLSLKLNELIEITGVREIHRLDRELDHLRVHGLIGSSFSGGFKASSENLDSDVTPTYLALSLFVRSHGSNDSPLHYWAKDIKNYEEYINEERKKQI